MTFQSTEYAGFSPGVIFFCGGARALRGGERPLERVTEDLPLSNDGMKCMDPGRFAPRMTLSGHCSIMKRTFFAPIWGLFLFQNETKWPFFASY